MIEQSVLNLIECMISSSLTVFNVQMNSQGVYNCVVQDNNFTLSMSRSIMLNIQNSSSKGTYICTYALMVHTNVMCYCNICHISK